MNLRGKWKEEQGDPGGVYDMVWDEKKKKKAIELGSDSRHAGVYRH